MHRFPDIFAALALALMLSMGFSQDSWAQETAPQLDGAPAVPDLEPAPNLDQEPGNDSVAAAARLREIVARIDPSAEFTANGANFRVETTPVTLVYDINADRMRLVAPIISLTDIDTETLLRVMQANFDSALDARYALAQGVLWSTFIHPLSSLSSDDFGSGLGQTVNLVRTYGSTYSSGVLIFGGGDSQQEQRELIEELQDKSREI